MRIGYPCINRTLAARQWRSDRTFRLASFSEARFRDTVAQNLAGLREILRFNGARGLLFFRITSDLVPFASHPVCRLEWWRLFATELADLGRLIRAAGMRISMHPDQFTLLNAPDPEIVARSVAELRYHARVLDALGLDETARIQIHVGGAYGDKPAAMQRFTRAWAALEPAIRRRLVIENDDRLYTLADYLVLHEETGVPVLFDFFHHRLHGAGEAPAAAARAAARTWPAAAGILMADYSSQKPGERPGRHAESIDLADFAATLADTAPLDFDLMLEIKDKEASALQALAALASDPRVPRAPRRAR
jgi:UV DNA damage endonuclease